MNKTFGKKRQFPQEIDFSHREDFPGVEGNPFDIILKGSINIDLISWPIFLLLLLIVAFFSSGLRWSSAVILFVFFLTDWYLIHQLPKKNISFGPVKPPVLFLAILRACFAWTPLWMLLILQIIGSILVVYGFFFETQKVCVTSQKLKSSKINNGTKIRLLHLGDLHIERISPREIELNRLVRDMAPDIILFSGDILNLSYLEDKQSWKDALTIISDWQAPLGTYLVAGSPAVDLPENMADLLEGCPITWLDQQGISIEQDGNIIEIYGINCTHLPHVDEQALNKLIQTNHKNNDQNYFSILLYHSPDLAPIAAKYHIDLQLSGHTHGGQVCIPGYGAIFTGSLYGKSFESGRYQQDQTTLYITRGIGLEGAGAPRVRFLCPPEIILWEISSE